MSDSDKKKGSLKEKVVHELVEYWINVCYLTLVFAAFTQYRRFLLAAHDIVRRHNEWQFSGSDLRYGFPPSGPCG